MNLRFRFILSNVLPLFIVLPLMSLLSIYIFERRILIPQQSTEIEADMELLTHLVLDEPDAFESELAGSRFVQRYSAGATWRLMILDSNGTVIATNNEDDLPRVGSPVDRPEFSSAISEGQQIDTAFSQTLDSETIDLWAPVHDSSDKLLGVVRVTQPLETLADEVIRMRGFMIAVMGIGLLLGTLIGFGLAVSMEIPLRKMTHSLQSMAGDKHPSPIELDGPEEIRTLSSAFNHLVNRIQELETTRKILLANLVHELGRPLGAMRAAIHALSQGAVEDPELREELLAGMDTQSRDLERLVDDLTQLYDESMGRFEVKLEDVEIDEWLRDSIATWKPHAHQKELQIDTQIADLPRGMIDLDRMGQALGNLISNAIKFTPKGGRILVNAYEDSQSIIIQIDDSGPGLSEDELSNIFTPFYRGEQGTRFPKGMGLGLSIARDIIQAHNGTLEAENLAHQGTRFTIRLPTN